MTILETRNLKKYYGSGDTQVKALDGVDLGIGQGEFVAIVGTSGSGKSTLLHMLGGLDRPTSGTVTVDGKDIFALKDEALTIFRRRKIGFVFQSYNLVPVLSVWENIVLPVELDGRKVDEAYVQEVIATLGLEKKLQNLPGQLSGGQQQRVAIARALATKPAILLADEPTGNLDSRTSQDVLGLMKVTGQKFAQTMVMITHNEEIAQMADRIVRIEDGRIVTRSGGKAHEGFQSRLYPPPEPPDTAGKPHPKSGGGAGHCTDGGALHLSLYHCPLHQRGHPAEQFPPGRGLVPRHLQVSDGGAVCRIEGRPSHRVLGPAPIFRHACGRPLQQIPCGDRLLRCQ